MVNPLVGVAAVSAGSGLLGARAQSKAASRASDAQVQAAELSVAEQRRQFDRVQELLNPFVEGGTEAFQGLRNLAGVGDAGAQAQAIQDIQQGPEFLAALQAGEEGILSNAAATGGLRGGNTQAALAQFRPQLLSNAIGQQYQRLGGLAQIGQSSAAGVGAAGQNFANAASQQYGQIGASQAGAALAQGRAQAQGFGSIGRGLGTVFGAGIPEGGIPADQTIFSRWGF